MLDDGHGQGASLLLCVKEAATTAVGAAGAGAGAGAEGGYTEAVPEYGVCCVDTVVRMRMQDSGGRVACGRWIVPSPLPVPCCIRWAR